MKGRCELAAWRRRHSAMGPRAGRGESADGRSGPYSPHTTRAPRPSTADPATRGPTPVALAGKNPLRVTRQRQMRLLRGDDSESHRRSVAKKAALSEDLSLLTHHPDLLAQTERVPHARPALSRSCSGCDPRALARPISAVTTRSRRDRGLRSVGFASVQDQADRLGPKVIVECRRGRRALCSGIRRSRIHLSTGTAIISKAVGFTVDAVETTVKLRTRRTVCIDVSATSRA